MKIAKWDSTVFKPIQDRLVALSRSWSKGKSMIPFSHFCKQDASGKVTRLIVFVHGVLGGAATTWGDSTKDTFWPAMVGADERFANFDIYVMNYFTPVFGAAPSIYETASNQLSQLQDLNVFSK